MDSYDTVLDIMNSNTKEGARKIINSMFNKGNPEPKIKDVSKDRNVKSGSVKTKVSK